MDKKVGFGGGCHWCTEAIFLSLKGVRKVEQGWIASQVPNDSFSEAVIVTYDSSVISLDELTEIHLHTHSSTSLHSMRDKYRSAVYAFNKEDEREVREILKKLQPDFEQRLITQVLPFVRFTSSLAEHIDYYFSNPEKPFCTLYIDPKLKLLRQRFAKLTDDNKFVKTAIPDV